MSRFFDTDNWREIGVTLARNKTRTLLTAFGIFWGTAMLAMLTGGASGLRGIMSRQFAGISTNMVFLAPQATTLPYKGFNKGSTWSLTDRDLHLIRTYTPHIDASSGMVVTGNTVINGAKSKTMNIVGCEADYSRIQTHIIYSGRFINQSDVQSSAKVAVIGKNAAAELFGSEDPVGRYVNAGGVYVKIIGVAGQKGDASIVGRVEDNLVMPYTTVRRAFNMGDKVGFFLFTIDAGHRLSEIKGDIWRAICANHPISPDDEGAMQWGDMAQMFEQIEGVFLAISLLAMFVGMGTLIAGVIGVGNIMWIIVKERTREIGIRRAIGARPRDIIFQILAEGTVLTTIAGLAGIVFATAVLAVAEKMTFNPTFGSAGFQLPFATAVSIMLTFIVLGSLAGLIPAIKAMRIKPIEAINDK